ncbi:MAG: hypothetical protein A3D31_09075 [Candidatus Fluviicola riflensis]|nr:MAG: hypothetical protein CHH17_13485 [Candidatus Fluviicola riflensis]OGS77161.1 MAG: hypothetical protein A3D31_09075 [Candidatus Fluviicola riflensis]OGS82096.1 MAG: hypothetical protein A2724_18020 [Fluviicola sp. RIFCSPHIGHO2_01_FULL_43_53]OGS87790.1 MAG: hypothetical protein A3E30_15455 [Fluviicola sp. RIFCSPHIGHO2_12_FULL_43_24]
MAICLLICFTLPVGGTYLWLRYERKLVRREVKATLLKGLNKKELVLLTFTAAEEKMQLEWEHSGEFSFRNQKYDIVSRNKVGKRMHYWCWKDTKESAIDRRITELTQKAWEDDDVENNSRKTTIETVKMAPEKRIGIPLFNGQFSIDQHPFFDYSESISSTNLIPTFQPPESNC